MPTYSCCNPACDQSFSTQEARDNHEQFCIVPGPPEPPEPNASGENRRAS